MKPIHKAICAGAVGAVLAFVVAQMVCGSSPPVIGHDGMVFIVCGPQVEDGRPWYSAFLGYVLTFTPMLLFTSRTVSRDTFGNDTAA